MRFAASGRPSTFPAGLIATVTFSEELDAQALVASFGWGERAWTGFLLAGVPCQNLKRGTRLWVPAAKI